MKNKLFLFTLLLLAVITLSCSKDHELKESYFVPDPDNPELPAYSEWGYNTFGCFYDRQTFIYDDYTVPLKVIVNDSGTSFDFAGKLSGTDYYNGKMTLRIKFSDFKPTHYSELADFNQQVVNLEDSAIKVSVILNNVESNVEIISGSIEFKRAQLLRVDEEELETILSGYFDFKAIINGVPITVSDGRFDVGVGNDNFYIL